MIRKTMSLFHRGKEIPLCAVRVSPCALHMFQASYTHKKHTHLCVYFFSLYSSGQQSKINNEVIALPGEVGCCFENSLADEEIQLCAVHVSLCTLRMFLPIDVAAN